MDKNVSIVLVDKRPYRKIAQDNWGLTNEQMRGKHVHHRVSKSDGGTNDPSNLYVCSPSFHRWGWHKGEEWIEWAEGGAQKAHEDKDGLGRSVLGVENGKRLHKTKNKEGKSLNASKGGRKGGKKTHSRKNEDGKSIHALETVAKAHTEKNSEGKSILGVKNAERMHFIKDHEGKSVNAVKAGKKRAQTMNQEKNEQGKSVHSSNAGKRGSRVTNSQLWVSTVDGFVSTAGPVANHNKANGWDPKAKIKLEQKEINR
jgi:hypothetical protein